MQCLGGMLSLLFFRLVFFYHFLSSFRVEMRQQREMTREIITVDWIRAESQKRWRSSSLSFLIIYVFFQSLMKPIFSLNKAQGKRVEVNANRDDECCCRFVDFRCCARLQNIFQLVVKPALWRLILFSFEKPQQSCYFDAFKSLRFKCKPLVWVESWKGRRE